MGYLLLYTSSFPFGFSLFFFSGVLIATAIVVFHFTPFSASSTYLNIKCQKGFVSPGVFSFFRDKRSKWLFEWLGLPTPHFHNRRAQYDNIMPALVYLTLSFCTNVLLYYFFTPTYLNWTWTLNLWDLFLHIFSCFFQPGPLQSHEWHSDSGHAVQCVQNSGSSSRLSFFLWTPAITLIYVPPASVSIRESLFPWNSIRHFKTKAESVILGGQWWLGG